MMKKDWVYRRGDIYYADLNRYVVLSRVASDRVVVIQNNIGYCTFSYFDCRHYYHKTG